MRCLTIFVLVLSIVLPVRDRATPTFQPRELLPSAALVAGGSAPSGWNLPQGASWGTESGRHILRFVADRRGQTSTVNQRIPLQPEWGVLLVSCRVRTRDVVIGPEGWNDARIAMAFYGDKGERVGEWPDVLHWTGTTGGWRRESREFFIPAGASAVSLDIGLMVVERGEVDFDDLSVKVVRPRPTLEDAPAPAAASAPPWRSRTTTRETICLNGLWRFRPIGVGDDVPSVGASMLASPPPIPSSAGWGWIAVPGAWPGRGTEGHRPVAPDIWAKTVKWQDVEGAWYRRDVRVPASWAHRRVDLSFEMPQTQATVWIDGRPAGSVRWPGGSLDVTQSVRPGATAHITAFVTSLPFTAARMASLAPATVREAGDSMRFRGLCGDVYLEAMPAGPRIDSVQWRPSVRRRSLGMLLRLKGRSEGQPYVATVSAAFQGVAEATWTSQPVRPGPDGTVKLTMPWLARRLWDLDSPNLYDVRVILRRPGSRAVLDERVERVGYREVWLAGRDVILNGTRVHWRCLNFSNHTSNAGAASYAACRDTFRRMRSFGFNFVIMANYGVDPGESMSFADLLRAADDEGFLLSFSLPHPVRSSAGWDIRRSSSEEYRALARKCIEIAENHPSVLAYAMSHNALGYNGDQDPAHMDGLVQPQPPADQSWLTNNRKGAAIAEAFAKSLDPTRLVYHHESGNMGDWHTVNIYLNWAPMQERMEWLSHWADKGVKPLFFVEWGLPHQASWGSHRLGPFIWSNKVSPEPWAVEFGAAITGDAAYRLTGAEERHIDNYERIYAAGQPFGIWDVLSDYWDSAREHNMVEIQSEFTRHVWPAFRTWGISAVLPWDQGNMARPVAGARPERPCTWKPADLGSPGIHPDFVPNSGDWTAVGDPGSRQFSSLADTFRLVNRDILAYIAGSPERFTDRSHIYRPGQTFRKQAAIVNDTRRPLSGRCTWVVEIGERTLAGGGRFTAAPGDRALLPITVTVPPEASGAGRVRITVVPDHGSPLSDTFAFAVVPRPIPPMAPVAVYDPRGDTTLALKRLGVRVVPAGLGPMPQGARALVVGRLALTVDGPFPDVRALLRGGGTVLVMEQSEAVLSRRLGFRTSVPSLRSVCVRVPDHPAVAGISNDLLRDWHGDATLIPSRYDLPLWQSNYPTVDWLGFQNTRAWKWGNRGQVASVVIEKPQAGDFLPILDGGFDQQYTPILEARVGGGRMLFCQMDVSGTSEEDPAAQLLICNLIRYIQTARPPASERRVVCVGAETKALVQRLGAVVTDTATPGADDVVVVAGAESTAAPRALREMAEAGARVVLLGAQREMLAGAMPGTVRIDRTRITHTPPPIAACDAWRGIGPAELHFRGRTSLCAVSVPLGVGVSVSTGVLAEARIGSGRLVHCGVTPLMFDYRQPRMPYLKLTFKRTAFLVSRLLANQDAAFRTPLIENWSAPPPASGDAKPRWLTSYYLDVPVANDDPYRYNRW